jgi:hypothetical protein
VTLLVLSRWILQVALVNASKHLFEALDRSRRKIEDHSVFGLGTPHGFLGYDLHGVAKVATNFSLPEIDPHH